MKATTIISTVLIILLLIGPSITGLITIGHALAPPQSVSDHVVDMNKSITLISNLRETDSYKKISILSYAIQTQRQLEEAQQDLEDILYAELMYPVIVPDSTNGYTYLETYLFKKESTGLFDNSVKYYLFKNQNDLGDLERAYKYVCYTPPQTDEDFQNKIYGGRFTYTIEISINKASDPIIYNNGDPNNAETPDQDIIQSLQNLKFKLILMKPNSQCFAPQEFYLDYKELDDSTQYSFTTNDYSTYALLAVLIDSSSLNNYLKTIAKKTNYIYNPNFTYQFTINYKPDTFQELESVTTNEIDSDTINFNSNDFLLYMIDTLLDRLNRTLSSYYRSYMDDAYSKVVNSMRENGILQDLENYETENEILYFTISITFYYHRELYVNGSLEDSDTAVISSVSDEYNNLYHNTNPYPSPIDIHNDIINERLKDLLDNKISSREDWKYYKYGLDDFGPSDILYDASPIYMSKYSPVDSDYSLESIPLNNSVEAKMNESAVYISTYPLPVENGSNIDKIGTYETEKAYVGGDSYDKTIYTTLATKSYGYSSNNTTISYYERYYLGVNFHIAEGKVKLSGGIQKNKVVVNVKLYPIIDKYEVKPELVGDGIVSPGLAPLGGNGLLDTIAGSADSIGLGQVTDIVNGISSFLEEESVVKRLLPTYYPVPLINRGLSIVAPGEYFGGYFLTPAVKIASNQNLILGAIKHLSTPLISVITENVTFTVNPVDGSGSIDNIFVVAPSSDGSTNIENSNTINVYSFGLGFGELLDKGIGSRLYITPSSSLVDREIDPVISQFLDSPLVSAFIQNNNNNDQENSELNYAISLLLSILPEALLDTISNTKNAFSNILLIGSYVQPFVYLPVANNDNSDQIKTLWPYLMITAQDTGRFVITSPGEYYFNASSEISIFHIRVAKVGGLIPIPVPVFISIKQDNPTSSKIEVREMKPLPLFVSYEPPTLTEDALNYNDIENYGYLNIYAVPVWIKDNKPYLPVLMRGYYMTDDGSSSLSIIATMPSGTVINSTDVYFFGLPMNEIKIPMSYLQSSARTGQGEIELHVGWKHGRIIMPNIDPGQKYVIELRKSKSFTFSFDGEKAVLYTGVYDPSNKIHALLEDITNTAEDVSDRTNQKLTEFESQLLSINDAIEQISMLYSQIDQHIQHTQQQILDYISTIPQAIVAYLMNTVTAIVTQAVVSLVTNIVVSIIIPVPGLDSIISHTIEEELSNIIVGYITSVVNNIFNGDSSKLADIKNIFIDIIRLGLTYVGLNIFKNLVSADFVQSMLSKLREYIENAIYIIDNIKVVLNITVQVFKNSLHISVYKPILISKGYFFEAPYYELLDINGVIGNQGGAAYILPVDILEIDSSYGGIVYVQPYSSLSVIYDFLTGNNNPYNESSPNVFVDINNTMWYISSWINQIIKIINNDEPGQQSNQVVDTLSSIRDFLQDTGNSIDNALDVVDDWVYIPGLSVDVLPLPCTATIPPVKI